jgi:hypothetical protein
MAALHWHDRLASARASSRAVLAREWSQLRRRYPESPWWSRADVFDFEKSSS